jgi:hypothetical protein
MSKRGNCDSCGGDYQVTRTGVIRKHERFGALCAGSGQPPKREGE